MAPARLSRLQRRILAWLLAEAQRTRKVVLQVDLNHLRTRAKRPLCNDYGPALSRHVARELGTKLATTSWVIRTFGDAWVKALVFRTATSPDPFEGIAPVNALKPRRSVKHHHQN